MGVYSTDRHDLSGVNLEEMITPNESYCGMVGLNRILVENAQNDMAIFDAIIRSDINEAVSIHEGTLMESELETMHEGMARDFFVKVKDFLKKMLEKIKGVLATFYAKVTNVVVRDGKKFVDMHKKNVVGKNLSKMKYKFAAKKKDELGKVADVQSIIDKDLGDPNTSTFKSKEDISSARNAWDDDDSLIKKLLAPCIGNNEVEPGEFAKEAHSYLFEDVEEVEGVSDLQRIMGTIINADKNLKALKDNEKELTKNINAAFKKYDKLSKTNLKEIPGNKEDKAKTNYAERMVAYANASHYAWTVYQTAVNKCIGAGMDAVKFDIKQCRAVFAKAAAFNPKSVKESAILEDAAYASEFDIVEESFEDFEY